MLNDPFLAGRNSTRLLFDFSISTSFLNYDNPNKKLLDFACGTGWTSEFLNKLGFDVYGFDIDKEVIKIATDRVNYDQRISPTNLHFQYGDGHKLPFTDNFFGHLYCFDSLHHMKDFNKVFKEIYRVLDKSGIAIFVEPGSKHADSKETRQFLKDHPHDDYWIERSIILDEIYDITNKIGFKNFSVKPFLFPSLVNFSFTDWYNILNNSEGKNNYFNELRRFNYEDRVIFSLSKI